MRTKLTKRSVDAVPVGTEDNFLWDTDVKGFGLKVTPAGRKVYLLQSRLKGRLRRFTIGAHGSPWTPETARAQATAFLSALGRNEDPLALKRAARRDLSLSELCDLYLAEGCTLKKASTISVDRGRIERHIKPLLGQKGLAELSRPDIERFMVDVAKGKTATDVRTKLRGRSRVTGGKGTATRTVGLFGAILTFAVSRGLRADNPCRGIKRYKDRRSERFLRDEELSRLVTALADAAKAGVNLYAIGAIKLLLLTGMRKGEALSLQHAWIDFDRGLLKLPDSKTGAKAIPVGSSALDLLRTLPRVTDNPHVFPGTGRVGHLTGLQKIWKQIRIDADLSGLRLHDLRHHFISVGASSGESLYILGKVAGHRQASTTQRYAHLADDPVRSSAERISTKIASQLSSSAS